MAAQAQGLTPLSQGAPQQGAQSQDGPSGQQQPDGRSAIMEFRSLAEQVQSLASKYPEFTESAAKILKDIQSAMVRVVGNPSRTPETQSAPVA